MKLKTGKIVAKLRKKKGISQLSFGLALGIDQARISRLEKGEGNWLESQIVAAAEFLETTPGYLIDGGEKIDQTPQPLLKTVNYLTDEPSGDLPKKYADIIPMVPEIEWPRVIKATNYIKKYPEFDEAANLFFAIFDTGDKARISEFAGLMRRITSDIQIDGIPLEPGGSVPLEPRSPVRKGRDGAGRKSA